MFVHSIRIVLVATIVSWTLNNSNLAVIILVIVDLIDVEFFSASDVSTLDHSHIIHLGR